MRYERLTRYEPGFHGRFTGVNAAFSRIWLSRRRDALQLYEGELMPGFVVPGCADLDFWLAEQRAALRERAAATARALACRLETDKSLTEAARWARRAVRYTGADGRVLRHAVRMLDRLGDRPGALQRYDEFTRRVRQALDVEPSAETVALIATLKNQ